MYWEMTNKEMMQIAMEQSAEDIGCKPEEFLSDKNVITNFQLGASAKKYYKLPISGNFISYGNNVVAAAADENYDIIKEYLNKGEFYHLFETPKMRQIGQKCYKKWIFTCMGRDDNKTYRCGSGNDWLKGRLLQIGILKEFLLCLGNC